MDKNQFYGALIGGDLHRALTILDEVERAPYEARFVHGEKAIYPVLPPLNRVLDAYQDYWRTVFWQKLDAKAAEDRLRAQLTHVLQADRSMELDGLEEGPVQAAFAAQGLYSLGGRTGGTYGPYAWKNQRDETFAVELPEGTTEYTVRFMDGFVIKSWLDWLSFGALGTGGWSKDGLICCVAESYDVESERFQVSLLKHEAQHVRDLERWPSIDPETLEYRAKLVELIYTKERDLLREFRTQAGTGNSHALAAKRIADQIGADDAVHTNALELFCRSSAELQDRYGEEGI